MDVARCLIEYETDIRSFNCALYEAVVGCQVEVAVLLLKNGADFYTSVPETSRNPWIFACRRNSSNIVRLFLEHGADPNAVDAKGESPIKVALEHPEVIKALLEYGADPDAFFGNGSTAMLELLSHKKAPYPEALTVLLQHGADPNIAHSIIGETPLIVAAVTLEVDLVKLLLEYGADVTQVDQEGRSVLDMLGDEKYSEVCELCTQYIECNKAGGKPVLK